MARGVPECRAQNGKVRERRRARGRREPEGSTAAGGEGETRRHCAWPVCGQLTKASENHLTRYKAADQESQGFPGGSRDGREATDGNDI